MTRSTPEWSRPPQTSAEQAILRAAGVTMQFGGLRALNDVSFGLAEGEIIGLIGPNGAGKTTLFNCLTGQYTPTTGTISRSGRPLPEDPARVTEEGVAARDRGRGGGDTKKKQPSSPPQTPPGGKKCVGGAARPDEAEPVVVAL